LKKNWRQAKTEMTASFRHPNSEIHAIGKAAGFKCRSRRSWDSEEELASGEELIVSENKHKRSYLKQKLWKIELAQSASREFGHLVCDYYLLQNPEHSAPLIT